MQSRAVSHGNFMSVKIAGGVGAFRFLGRVEGVTMIAKNWMKWTAGTITAALVLVTMPAVGQARAYTGKTPASIASTTIGKHARKLSTRHKKLTKHSKHHQLSTKHHHVAKAAKIKA
jgi:hypothetical protein